MDSWSLVEGLAGDWSGVGEGAFPTIDPFRYREELKFTRRAGERALGYEQRTWRLGGDEDGEPSHGESGFLLPAEDGTIHLLNAQASGRVEVLVGRATDTGGEVTLDLKSVVHAHDARMRSTRRVLTWNRSELRYEAFMATDRVAEPTRHLSATLGR